MSIAAASRGVAVARAMILAVVLIGMLLAGLGIWVVHAEYARQRAATATAARVVENQIAAIATAANGRVLTLRAAAQYAIEAAGRGEPPPSGWQGVRGDIVQYGKPNGASARDAAIDRAVIDRLWLTQAGLHAAAPEIALSYVMSAITGAAGNYPSLPPAEHQAMASRMAARAFDPAANAFVASVAHRGMDEPPLWTPVYRDPLTGRSRAGRSLRNDGRLVSLLAPVRVAGRYRMMVGIDIWASELREVLRTQRVPGAELTLIDGDGHVIATSRPTDVPLAAGPFGKGSGTDARAFLGLDPRAVPADGQDGSGRFVTVRNIGRTPLRLVTVADGGKLTGAALGRLAPLLAAMTLLYALLCAVAWYVLRRVLAPAFRLAAHIERSGEGASPPVSRLWRPTLAAIDTAFAGQRAAVTRLEEAHATTSAVLDAAFDAVVLVDSNLRIVSANIAFARMFAPAGVASVGKPLPALIAPRGDQAEIEAALGFAGESMAAPLVFDARGSGRRRFAAELQARRIRQGERELLVVFVRDITERRRFEAEVASQREALHQSEKMSALGSLLAGVSHELNNPLSVVLGRSAVLAEQLAGTPHENALHKLRAAVDRCGRIVRTFLAIARHSAPERGAVEINALVNDALEITGYGLRTAGIELALDLDPALPLTSADGDQLVQVVINLIVNAQHALAALPPGAPRKLSIVTRHDAAKREIALAVADNGPGVPDEARRRIFEPFFTTKPVGEGTGMGLSVSRGIVEAHGGTLALVNPGEGGARFVLSIPVEPVAASRPAAKARRKSAPNCGAILIVDDEPDVAELIADSLRPLGHEIATAASGAEALAHIVERAFDAVFCDVRMPGIDGPEVWRRAREARPGQERRFVFVTGDFLAGETRRRLAETGCAVIEKPFEPAQIRAAAEALLETNAIRNN